MTIYDRSPLKIFCYDISAHTFMFLNTAFMEFFGLPGETIHPASLLEIVHPDDRQLVKKSVDDCLQKGSAEGVECRIMHNEYERFVRLHAYLHKENDGSTAIVGHAEDITIYVEQTNILNKHNTQKNAILNILSHDLAGPIGLVGNLAQLLRKETVPLNNLKIDSYLEMVDKVTQKAAALIRNFIAIEFLESEAVKLMKRRVELVEKIANATEEYMLIDQELNLQFYCSGNKDAIYVEIDEDKFMQVIQNLISNAMKFTPDGGKISIFLEERDHTVLLSVSDNGIGIPVQYHNSLFDKFTDARRNGLKGQPSTGLGMSIIKTIVEWHDGKIWFESKVDEGTTFYIELPK